MFPHVMYHKGTIVATTSAIKSGKDTYIRHNLVVCVNIMCNLFSIINEYRSDTSGNITFGGPPHH